MFTRIFGSHPSVTNSPVKGSSIIALTNLPSKILSCQQRRNSWPFTTQVLEDSIVCGASVSVGFSAHSRPFSLIGGVKIGASATCTDGRSEEEKNSL